MRGGGGGGGAASGAMAVLPAAVPAHLAGQPFLSSVESRVPRECTQKAALRVCTAHVYITRGCRVTSTTPYSVTRLRAYACTILTKKAFIAKNDLYCQV